MPYAYLGFFVEGVGTSHSLKPGGNLLLIRLPAPYSSLEVRTFLKNFRSRNTLFKSEVVWR